MLCGPAAGLLPLAQLMVESDAPFMTPDGLPAALGIGRKNEPCTLPRTVAAIAEARRGPTAVVVYQFR